MRTILLALTFFIIYPLQAQRVCVKAGTPTQQPASLNNLHITEILGGIEGTNTATPAGVIRIPVVVHVVYQNEAQNISDAQIKSGIAALNRDFRRRNADTVNTPARFKALAADVEIEFVLATSDPRGGATSGIVRKQTSVKEWTIDDKIKRSKTGGDDAWDAAQYLNIWVGHMPRTLGYSSMPGESKEVDGIVIHTPVFSGLGKSGAYNMGRTLVHEVGHWLGLKHIWGDADCGDDGIADTPRQGGFTSGCPNYFLSSCDNGTMGDMYMNYMDFTNDACMNLFTLGQKTKMRSLFATGGFRRALLASKGLFAPTIEAAPIVSVPAPKDTVATAPATPETRMDVARPALYPNPATGWVMVTLPDASWLGKELQVVGMNGGVAKKLTITSLQQKVALAGLANGMYFIQGFCNGTRITEKFIKATSGQ
jgi:hypothetical protein